MTLPDLDPWRRLATIHTMLSEAGRLLRACRTVMTEALHDTGLSYDDIGREAGVSRQRAQQWANKEEGTR